jgi:hypothetical protein
VGEGHLKRSRGGIGVERLFFFYGVVLKVLELCLGEIFLEVEFAVFLGGEGDTRR